MPTVPQYGSPQVRPGGLPDVRVSGESSAEAFGGGQSTAQAFGATRELAQAGGQLLQQKLEAALHSEIQDTLGKLSAEETRLKVTMQQAKGKDAIGASSKAVEDFDKFYQGLDKSIQNGTVRNAAGSHYRQFRRSLGSFGQQYANVEYRQYQDQATQALIKNEFDAAIADGSPERIKLAITRQVAAVHAKGARDGWSAEVLKQQASHVASGTHLGVLNKMLAEGNDLAAETYFQAFKGEIVGEDSIRATQAMEEGSRRGEALRILDEVFAPFEERVPTGGNNWTMRKGQAKTLGEAMPRARKLLEGKDAGVRTMVENMVKARVAEIEAVRDEEENARYESATKLVDGNPGKDPELVVPPDDWNRMSVRTQDALRKRAVRESNNNSLWLAFTDLASTAPEKIAALNSQQFEEQFWVHFSPEVREKARLMWEHARKGQGEKLTDLISPEESIKTELRRASIIPWQGKLSDEQEAAYATYREIAQKRINDFERSKLGGKRKATDEELRTELKKALTETVMIRRSVFRGNVRKRIAELTPDERENAFEPLPKIPEKDITDIASVLAERRKLPDKGLAGMIEAIQTARARAPKEWDEVRNWKPQDFEGPQYHPTSPAAYADSLEETEQMLIRSELEAKGYSNTIDKIERIYGAMRLGDRARVEAILNER